MLGWLLTAAGVSVVAAVFYVVRHLGWAQPNPNYKFVDCWYCKDENGKPQGWLELFNSAEYQGKTGYWPATRVNGNVIACPVCGATGIVAEGTEEYYSAPGHRF